MKDYENEKSKKLNVGAQREINYRLCMVDQIERNLTNLDQREHF